MNKNWAALAQALEALDRLDDSALYTDKTATLSLDHVAALDEVVSAARGCLSARDRTPPPADREDAELSARELRQRYEKKGEHPRITRATWMTVVEAKQTLQGYWPFVKSQLALEEAQKRA